MNLGHVADITGKVVGFITLNGFADTVLADYFWARAVILTSPTVATIGMSVTIPIAILTDYALKGVSATWISIFGALLVVIGFILVNLAQDFVDKQVERLGSYCFPAPAATGNNDEEDDRESSSSFSPPSLTASSSSGHPQPSPPSSDFQYLSTHNNNSSNTIHYAVISNPLIKEDEKSKRTKEFDKIIPVT